MPGVTKHIFDRDIRDIISMLRKQLKSIQKILPKDYTDKDVMSVLKRFYPHEWHSVEIKYLYYQKKDRYLRKHIGKARYNMNKPERLLQNIDLYKTIMSHEYRQNYSDNYSEELFLSSKIVTLLSKIFLENSAFIPRSA